MVLDQAQRGLKLNTPEAIHGSLLGYKELFLQGKAVSVQTLITYLPTLILLSFPVHARSISRSLQSDSSL